MSKDRRASETMDELADRLHPGSSKRTSRRGKTAVATKTLGGKSIIVSGRSKANAEQQMDKKNAKEFRGNDTKRPQRGTRVGGGRIVGGGF